MKVKKKYLPTAVGYLGISSRMRRRKNAFGGNPVDASSRYTWSEIGDFGSRKWIKIESFSSDSYLVRDWKDY